ncbi:MAG: hypothetical protein UT29_C0001G0131 [Candidatus Yanofskybacteria bacterium GW2011_GWA1_39_13]|uniref:Uncharacterized protein n=1 Tax=Yanofskybacteria sp. (strain GW2011_GWA1_39_13) TaxID=1619019 RepID=A0A0G0MQD6_YANXG|nr:MAG: hypothetical protein UT29_C0001G0131 [Candidatus Yanofskybacteria bacterium GW2011_GWA1_39_13]
MFENRPNLGARRESHEKVTVRVRRFGGPRRGHSGQCPGCSLRVHPNVAGGMVLHGPRGSGGDAHCRQPRHGASVQQSATSVAFGRSAVERRGSRVRSSDRNRLPPDVRPQPTATQRASAH